MLAKNLESASRKPSPTQELVLDCFRSPDLLRSLSDERIPLPEGFHQLLRLVVTGVDDPNPRDGHNGVGEAATELRDALLLFIKHVVLVEGANHYRTLGVNPRAPQEQVEQHYRWLLRLLQEDESEPTRRLCEFVQRVSKAYATIGDPVSRRIYDRTIDVDLPGAGVELPLNDIIAAIVEGRGASGAAREGREAVQGQGDHGARAVEGVVQPKSSAKPEGGQRKGILWTLRRTGGRLWELWR